MRLLPEETWHNLSSEAVIAAFESHETDGLSRQEADDRLARFGANELSRTSGPGTRMF